MGVRGQKQSSSLVCEASHPECSLDQVMLQALQVKGRCAAVLTPQVPKFLLGVNWHLQGLRGFPVEEHCTIK